MSRKPKARARRAQRRGPTVEQIKAALDQLEAAGLIERDRDAEAADGRLHIRLTHHKPTKQ